MRKHLWIIAAALLGLSAISCRREGARLEGQFLGAAQKTIYLERVVPGSVATIDSAVTNDKGQFRFRIALKDRQPTIFNLRYEGDMIPLLIAPGERVKVNSFCNISRSYRVSGSPESELVRELHVMMVDGMAALDSISNLFATSSPDEQRRRELTRAYYGEYYRIKREQIHFIVGNASNLAAVYALYQRLPGEEVLVNGESDFVYYRMVADSVVRRYPDSRYVVALEKELDERNRILEWERTLMNAEMEVADYPDIELPDMYGNKVKLSSLAGKVIVLDFWSASIPDSRVNNAEMKELYSELGEKGLAIYQVSLDTSKPLWVNTVQEQKLPWTTVCDFRGEQSVTVRTYNITRIPSNFIIDREGNIVARDLFGDKLAEQVRKLI